MLKADGFNEAIIGTTSNRQGETIIAYDREKCLGILMARDGMSHDDAEEFFSFNVEGAYHGECTPIFIELKI